jgi:diamine N-acetyltransferase
MKQLYCSISSDNKASLDLFKKASFEVIGLRRDWIFIESEWKDVIDFQLLNK